MSFLKHYDHLKIQMKDILSATDNFDSTKVIGSGGFGRVYKGELSLPEGPIVVAFKKLDRRLGQGNIEFWKEVMMLSKYKHENLVSLMYYCIEGDEMILGYEYASCGSLDRYLSDTNLTWIRRLKISVEAARGLNYLHDPRGAQERVIHRDIKSGNILLDENWIAKVSDFGLSKVGPANQAQTVLVSHAAGTPGYCDPVYLEMGFLSKESDVYSFGVVLFEILCGRLCYESNNGKLTNIFVPKWRRCYEEKILDEIIFPGLKEQMDPGSLNAFSAIAYQCVKKAREDRPMMAQVVKELEFALQQQDVFEDLKKRVDFETLIKTADDCKTHKVGPVKVLKRVRKKSNRKVELRSLISKPLAEEETKIPENEEPSKMDEKKDELLTVITVVFKAHMHCEACAQKVKTRILRIKGVESAEPDLKSSEMTVKGTFLATEMLNYVQILTGKDAIIVKQDPDPVEEDEKKDGNNNEKKEEILGDEGDDKQDPYPNKEEDYNAKDEKNDDNNGEKKEEILRDEGSDDDKQDPDARKEEDYNAKDEKNSEKNEEKLHDEDGDRQDHDPKKEEYYDAKDEKKDGNNDSEKNEDKLHDEDGDKEEAVDKREDITSEAFKMNYYEYRPVNYPYAYQPAPQIFSDENPNSCIIM
uniref:probable serine/threonine-protein kinase PBL17 n=1 Tax=Erigeron canadensis TaxID=72917 RepID=UPI001CB996BC|nr:probable serine/threonine-protein kinase PBL17 [Erigeron canadensis]